jgi:DNA-directed RNA polymerase subunit L
MELTLIEKGKDKLKVEVQGESHTLLNVLRENAWKAGAGQASYMIEHPYMAKPKIMVRAKDPKKVLTSAAQAMSDDSRAFLAAFKRACKR